MKIQVIATQRTTKDGESWTEWGISFDGINPDEENYIKCQSEIDAHIAKKLIESDFVSRENFKKDLTKHKGYIEKLTTPIDSTRNFEQECKIYVDKEADEWVFEYQGAIKKRSKSKFDCLIAKKEIQKELGV